MEKVFIDEEELDGTEEIDGILKVVVGCGELTRNINKKKPDGLQA